MHSKKEQHSYLSSNISVVDIIHDLESRKKWDKLFPVIDVLETHKHYRVVYWYVYCVRTYMHATWPCMHVHVITCWQEHRKGLSPMILKSMPWPVRSVSVDVLNLHAVSILLVPVLLSL